MRDFTSPIRKVRAKLRSAGVRRIGVFGSVLRGTAKQNSDVDVLVAFSPKKGSLRDLCEVADVLKASFKRRIDLVPVDSLDKYIGPEILRTVRYVSLN